MPDVTMADFFSKLLTYTKPHVQEAQRISRRINSKNASISYPNTEKQKQENLERSPG